MSLKYSKDPVMKFSLGQVVKCIGPSDGGTPLTGNKGQIFRMYHPEYNKSSYNIHIVEGSKLGNIYDIPEANLAEIKTQTLYAYEDKSGEVHWISKEYSEAQVKRQRLTRKKEFDKVFDIE